MRIIVIAALAAGVAAACARSQPQPATTDSSLAAHDVHAAAGETLTAEQLQSIAAVRNATARFQDTLVAQQVGGYRKQYPPGCAESPEGAQAYHYLNEALVDDKVELLEPELLMFEPQPDGSKLLVGVDYIVPLSASATPPTLLGVPFMRNEPLGVWALHIWAWRPNPSGMFAAWNPNVSCAHATS